MKFLPKFGVCSFLLVILLVSCASKPEEALTGRWQEASGQETLGFQKDGTFDAGMICPLASAPIDVRGTYAVKGDTLTLNVVKPPNLAPLILKIKLSRSNEELMVTFQQGSTIKLDGSVMTYRRSR